MSAPTQIDQILALPVDRKLAIIEVLWDSIATTPSAVPLPDWHRSIVTERLAEDDADLSGGGSWSDVRRQIEHR